MAQPKQLAVQSADQIDIAAIQRLHNDTFAIPKIELHAHITGCMRPQTFLELVETKGLDLYNLDFYEVTLEVAFEFFKLVDQLVTDIETLQRVTYEIIEDYAKQNCIYLELRATPKSFATGNTQPLDYIKAIIEVIEAAEKDFKIKVRFIASFNRARGVEAAEKTVQLLQEFKSPYIVGIELSGNPEEGDFLLFKELIQKVREQDGLKVSLRCAETK